MTVKEYIDELSTLDPNAPLYVWQWNNGTESDHEVSGARACPDGAVRICYDQLPVS